MMLGEVCGSEIKHQKQDFDSYIFLIDHIPISTVGHVHNFIINHPNFTSIPNVPKIEKSNKTSFI
jgi:hypothetical protein